MALNRSPILKIALALMILALPVASYGADLVGKPSGGGAAIEWQVGVSGHEAVELTVLTPSGDTWSRRFSAGRTPSFRLTDLGGDLADGQYNYRLQVVPRISADLRNQLKAARAAGNEAAARKLIREAGIVAPEQSGTFTILNGYLVTPGDLNERDSANARGITAEASAPIRRDIAAEDQVIPDDLIVQQSLCVGFDCVNNESFGVDTIRLKENNLRIHFEDTSTSAGFASNDWRLVANEQPSGGANMFAIEDSTAGRNIVLVEAGSPANSIYVDSTGRIGFRQSAPALELHITDTDTPAIRLEQTSAGGFTAQTWDIGANEANFFVRDVTGGSLLSFRIRPGAPTSSLDISSDGNVGIGTGSPTRALHVVDTGATDNTVLEISNNAAARIRMTNSANAETWNIGHQSPSGTGFVASDVGDAVTEMLLDVSGNMTIAGTLTQGSSREIKKDFADFDPAAALEGVQKLPILTWVYNNDAEAARHVGPMAEDFHAAFGLGVDNKHIAPSDQAGLALAAIQGLANKVDEKDARIAELEERLAQLEKQLAQNNQ